MTDKLLLLGFSGAYIPVIGDYASDILNCKHFDVVKNIEVKEPGYSCQFDEYTYSQFLHDSYDFELNAEVPVFLESSIYTLSIFWIIFLRNQGIEKVRYYNLV